MKLQRLVFTVLMLGAWLTAGAQGFVVHRADGSLAIFASEEVDSVTMVPQEDAMILGTWHLGFWKNGSTVIRFDGTEYMAFAGKTMVWGGRGSDVDVYHVTFNASTKSFIARHKMKSETLRWYVTQQTPSLLVLRDGTAYRYFYRSKEEAQNAQMELDPPSHTETSDINRIMNYATGKTKSTVTPMGRHFEGKHVTTDDDRAWLLDPANEPDGVAGMTRWMAKNIKLYPYDDPVPADVNQHAIGDCCAMAVFASMAYLYPDFIKSIITNNGNRTYTVKMYDPAGEPIEVGVSNKILCDANGNIGQVTGKNNVVTWATIMEKALMKWETIYKCVGVEGIATEHAAPLFTGSGESFAFAPNSLYTSELKLAIEHCLAEGMITVGGFNVPDLPCGKLKTVTGHAFTFMLADDESSVFVMRNPWGSEDVDGKLFIPDLRTTVQTIDARIVAPGAAAPYLRSDLRPYTPPKFVRRSTDLGVSERLLRRVVTDPNTAERW